MKNLTKLLLLFIVLLLGCEDENITNPSDENNGIIPLEVGNQWTYIDSSFDSGGSVNYVSGSILSISGSTNIQNNDEEIKVYYWNWVDMTTGKLLPHKWLMRNEDDGLYCYGGIVDDKNYLLGETLIYKFPIELGENWNSRDYVYSEDDSVFYLDETVNITCTGTNEKFNTGTEEYDCYVYNMNDGDYEYSYYLVNNIGIVGMMMKRDGVIRGKKTLQTNSLQKNTLDEDKNNPLNEKQRNVVSIFNI